MNETTTRPQSKGDTAIDVQWLLALGGVIERDEYGFDWIVFGTHEALKMKFPADPDEECTPDFYAHGSEALQLPWVETRNQLRALFKSIENASGFAGLWEKQPETANTPGVD